MDNFLETYNLTKVTVDSLKWPITISDIDKVSNNTQVYSVSQVNAIKTLFI